jgi:hypothetical protein
MWALVVIVTVLGHVSDNPLYYTKTQFPVEQSCLNAMPELAQNFLNYYHESNPGVEATIVFSCVEVNAGAPA